MVELGAVEEGHWAKKTKKIARPRKIQKLGRDDEPPIGKPPSCEGPAAVSNHRCPTGCLRFLGRASILAGSWWHEFDFVIDDRVMKVVDGIF